MSRESWYEGNPKDMIRIDESDDFIVDYDTKIKMYRVSYFEDYHFKDEFWFDAYKEQDLKVDD